MSPPSGEDVKPDVSKITLTVEFNGKRPYPPRSPSTLLLRSLDTELSFAYKKSKPLAKLLLIFCEKIGVDRKAVRFNCAGVNVEQEGATAESLGLEDGDILDGQVWQEGGSFFMNVDMNGLGAR
ncbi:hypothetical protein DFH09DRAFT_1128056 [Mycena vulgaris]|nr:hypothetical protein DFH09DRAFT_1128056 [Mycena vulgaris]